MAHDEYGREVPDPRPLEWPAGLNRPESIQSMIARMVMTEMSKHRFEPEAETFEEANDFEMDDEDPADAVTRYQDMTEELPKPLPLAKPPEKAAEASSKEELPKEPSAEKSADKGSP